MNAITRHWTAVRDALDNERARTRSVLRTEETDFLPAASISSGVINGVIEIFTAPDAFTAMLTASAELASGTSTMRMASTSPYA